MSCERVGAVGNQLIVTVNDAGTLRLIFSDQPMHATFTVELPGERVVKREATINYLER